jgi:ribosomal protein L2
MKTLVVLLSLSVGAYAQTEDPIVTQLREIKKTLEEIRAEHKSDLAKLEERISKLEKAKIKVVEEEAYGVIQIKNSYMGDIVATINGVKYQIKKGETKNIEFIPLGKFSYNVDVVGSETFTRNLTSSGGN